MKYYYTKISYSIFLHLLRFGPFPRAPETLPDFSRLPFWGLKTRAQPSEWPPQPDLMWGPCPQGSGSWASNDWSNHQPGTIHDHWWLGWQWSWMVINQTISSTINPLWTIARINPSCLPELMGWHVASEYHNGQTNPAPLPQKFCRKTVSQRSTIKVVENCSTCMYKHP